MFPGMGHLPPLNNLFQPLITLVVKIIFLTFSLNLPSSSLKPLPCPIATGSAKKPVLIFLISPLWVPKACTKVSLEPYLLQAEQRQLSQPFLTGEVLHPSGHLCGPPLEPLQQLHVFPVLRAPELDAGLQVGSQQSRGVESPPSTCWPRCFWCSPGHPFTTQKPHRKTGSPAMKVKE